MLHQTYTALLGKHGVSADIAARLWSEIEEQYSGKRKYYHNLQHLDHLLVVLTDVKNNLRDWDTILFTMYYHDIIYSAARSDNEEQSADLAGKRMQQIGLSDAMISNCKAQILATKKHLLSADEDTNYFTDADLSVLGQDWDTYTNYYKNVRKEYASYPDMVYNAGRRKVLKHFLSMDRIFKTPYFYDRFETQAKLNVFTELRGL